MEKVMSIKTILIGVLLVLTATLTAQDIPFVEETPGNYSAGDITIEGAIVGTPLTIDGAFAQQYGSTAPNAPFKIVVPDGVNRQMAAGGSGGEFVTVLYADEAGATKEILRFTSLTIPAGETDARLNTTAQLLINQGPGLVLSGWAEGKLESVYFTKIGGRYDAVTVHGWCSSPEEGTFYIRLTGILNPDSTEGLLAYVLIEPNLTGINGDQLISKGKTLEVIHSVSFLP
jgi:hypothetical protein